MNTQSLFTYYLGVDAGGTKCKAQLQDSQGNVIAEAQSGPANIAQDFDVAMQSITQACEILSKHPALPANWLNQTSAGMGFAGFHSVKAQEKLQSWPFPFAKTQVASDLKIACLGAHQASYGGVMVLGTGSSALACTASGDTQFGGYGFSLGDEASGAWLGRQVLQKVLHSIDGIEDKTPLVHDLINSLNITHPSDVVDGYLLAKPSKFAGLAPYVFAHAKQQDPFAIEIINQAVYYIGAIVQQMIERLRYIPNGLGQTPNESTYKVALIGGLAEPYSPYLPQALNQHLRAPKDTPEAGAVLLARQ